MLTCVVSQFCIIVSRSEHEGFGREQNRGGRARRRSSLGKYRVDNEYDMDDMDDDDIADDDMDDDDIDNFDDFEKVETTSALDPANDDAAVSMIPDISDIISAGNDNDGSGRGHGWR